MLEKVHRLIAYYDRGLIPRLAHHEVNPGLPLGSRENYLYFTLPVCINFQRSSPAMWAAALATYQDETTGWVFFPELLAEANETKIKVALTEHKLALQPTRHTLIWTTISRTLHEHYGDDPRRIITEARADAGQLIRLIQATHRQWFPYLCGPKLSNYWPFILLQYTDAALHHPEAISIIPDTHVLQSSVRLGMVPASATAGEVELAWKTLLAGTDITPSQMHPVLWHWSRNNFQPAVDA